MKEAIKKRFSLAELRFVQPTDLKYLVCCKQHFTEYLIICVNWLFFLFFILTG